jgi:hypothetical protein
MRQVNYNDVVSNLKDMINTLEYDSMRSPGKAKINADTLVNMYTLLDRYTAVEAPTVKQEAAVEEAPAKKPVGRPAVKSTAK